MRKGLLKFLKARKINEQELFQELDIDINKDDYTLEELNKLALKLRLPIKNLVSIALAKPTKIYSAKSFMKAINENRVDEVVQTIVDGCVVNAAGKFFFQMGPYRLNPRNEFTRTQMLNIIEFLLVNNEINLARNLSSKEIYYNFTSLNNDIFSKDVLLEYLIGNEDIVSFNLDYYAKDIYMSMDKESKEEYEDIMLEKYKELVKLHDYLVENNMIHYEKGWFWYEETIDENESIFNSYSIDDIYKMFSIEKKNKIETLVKEIYKNFDLKNII